MDCKKIARSPFLLFLVLLFTVNLFSCSNSPQKAITNKGSINSTEDSSSKTDTSSDSTNSSGNNGGNNATTDTSSNTNNGGNNTGSNPVSQKPANYNPDITNLVVDEKGKLTFLYLNDVTIFQNPADFETKTLQNAPWFVLHSLLNQKNAITQENASTSALFFQYSLAQDTSFSVLAEVSPRNPEINDVTLAIQTFLKGVPTHYTLVVKAYEKNTNPYGVYSALSLSQIQSYEFGSYLQREDIFLPNTNDPTAAILLGADYALFGFPTLNLNQGSYNGMNKLIRNFVQTKGKTDFGLFESALNLSFVQKVHLVDVSVSGDKGGALISNLSNSRVENCIVEGKVQGFGTNIGGMVGFTDASAFIFEVSGTINVIGNNYTGGVVGYHQGNLSDAHFQGDVVGTMVVGGLVGLNDAVGSTVSIKNSSMQGTVTGDYAGGLTGVNNGKISNNTVQGTISGGSPVGGAAASNEGEISNVIVQGTVIGTHSVGGLVGSNPGKVQASTFQGFVMGNPNQNNTIGSGNPALP